MIQIIETYENGVLVETREVEALDTLGPVEETDPLVAAIAAMTDDQKAALRAALGLT